MDPDLVFEKTDKGFNEIKTRKFKLNSRMRSILIVVDGKTPAGDLMKQLDHIKTIEEDINNLLAYGFLSIAADFKQQRKDLSRALTDVMGPHADYFTLELEDCADITELRGFIIEKRDMLERGLGHRGDKFWKIANKITR